MLVPVLLAAIVTALPCGDWEVVNGDLDAGLDCGTLLVTSDASTARFSYGKVLTRRPVALPFTATFTVRKLSSDSRRPLEILLVGGSILLRDGAIGPYFEGDAGFERDGWRELPGFRASDAHALEARQTEREVVLSIDGHEVLRRAVHPPGAGGKIGVAFKGPLGVRARVVVSGFRVSAP
jgi:hypothetical protein